MRIILAVILIMNAEENCTSVRAFIERDFAIRPSFQGRASWTWALSSSEKKKKKTTKVRFAATQNREPFVAESTRGERIPVLASYAPRNDPAITRRAIFPGHKWTSPLSLSLCGYSNEYDELWRRFLLVIGKYVLIIKASPTRAHEETWEIRKSRNKSIFYIWGENLIVQGQSY